MPSPFPSPDSALAKILLAKDTKALGELTADVVEQASDEALSISLELGQFAKEIRLLEAVQAAQEQAQADGPPVGGSRPRAHRSAGAHRLEVM